MLKIIAAFFVFAFLTPSLEAQNVSISELMAAGQEVLSDGDGDFPDWIELHNSGSTTVNLTGWHLTDDDALPKKWTFPAVNIPPGGYLVVFASAKNRRAAGQELHTNFSLAADGEYLALTRPDGTPVSALTFPAQHPGISFGAGARYFTTPTPGAANSTPFTSVASAPVFSKRHGFVNTPFMLTLTSATPGSVIRYTLDGSAPTDTHGDEYLAPISISKTSVVRAATFKAGALASVSVTRSYVFLADVQQQSLDGQAPDGWPALWGNHIVDYGMDPRIVNSPTYGPTFRSDLKSIPTISLVMDLPDLFDPTLGIYANPEQRGEDWERPVSVELLDPDGSDPGFQINAGIRIRGGASRSSDNPKHSFHILARGRYGAAELDYPLFGSEGASSTARFDLRCEQIASWHYTHDANTDFVRDEFARANQLALGQPGARGDFYHLYINGQYWGLYNTQERVRASFGQRYFGGKESDYDVVGLENTSGTAVKDGTFDSWVRLHNAAKAGLTSNAAYMKVQGLNPDGTRNPAFERLLDVDSLIVYMVAGIYQGINDAPPSYGTQNNWFALKSRRGDFGWRFFLHDSELSMYDINDNLISAEPAEKPFEGLDPEGSNPWHVWEVLRRNPEFRLRVADHLQRAFFNGGALTPASAGERFRALAQKVDRAVVGESARWGDAGGGFFPGPFLEENGQVIDIPTIDDKGVGGGGEGREPFTREDWVKATYERQLRDYIPGRSEIVLQQFKDAHLYPATTAPEFSQFGGTFQPGFELTITNPSGAGVVYYTLDGKDPRRLGGAINAGARPYAAPLLLDRRTTVKARVKNGNDWSALVSAEFVPAQDLTGLRITEIFYHPTGLDGANDDQEFLELKNTGTTPLNLGGYHFTSGIVYTFPDNTVLAPGAFWVLARNAAALGAPSNGIFDGKLSDSGETLTLATREGGKVLNVTYGDSAPWPITPDGLGFSLVPANDGDNDDPTSWRASAHIGGSPGADDPDPQIPHNIVNEVLASSDTNSNAVEFICPGSPVGWWLSDDPKQPKKFRIESVGVIVIEPTVAISPPVQIIHYFIPQTSFASAFTLKRTGGSIWLFSADNAGELTGYAHGFKYGATDAGVSVGRHFNSVGEEQFVAQSASTIGAQNAGPRQGEVVINEINYQPGNGGDEFVELRNTTTSVVAMDGWELDGLAFTFPAGASIAADGIALVVSLEPDVFRAKYKVAAEVPIFGPAPGILQNSGERLTLAKPGPVDGSGGVSLITVDSVRYNDRSPWPPAAAGSGPSLQRMPNALYGDDPISWLANGPTPGLPTVFNFAPTVSVTSPANGASFTQPTNVTLTAAAEDSDGTVQSVEFFADGQSLGTAAAPDFALTWNDAALGQHEITARATDDAGAVSESNPVVITVQLAPPSTGAGLFAEYFNNIYLDGSPVVTQADGPIDFDWTDVAPVSGLPVKNYSVRWTGQLQPRSSGDSTFYVEAAGGVRLWIDDQIIIDAWDSEPQTLNQLYGNVNFEAWRTYTVRLEYRDTGGIAGVRLSLSGSSGNPLLISENQLFLPAQNPLALGIVTGAHLPAARRSVAYRTQFSAARGTAPYKWSGVVPKGLTLTEDGVLSGKPTLVDAATSFRVQVTDAIGDIAEKQFFIEVQEAPGIRQLPNLTITNPQPAARLPEGTVELRGNAQYASGISSVRYSLNDGPWRFAIGRESWHVLLDAARGVVPGHNIVRVRAFARGGVASAESRLHFYSIVYRPLTVEIEGEGTVTPGFTGTTAREVGRSYTIVAKPAPGWVLADWVGQVYSNRRRVDFTMTDGAYLRARFIPDPLPQRAGTFATLLNAEQIIWIDREKPGGDIIIPPFFPTTHETRGIVTLTVTPAGMFTGVLRVASERYRLKGQFNVDGYYSTLLGSGPKPDPGPGPRPMDRIKPGGDGRYLSLYYNYGDNDHIGCSISSPFDFRSITGFAERSSFGSKNPCPWRGAYTVTLPHGELPAPQGDGFATLNVDARGKAKFVGTLADGTDWSSSGLFTDTGILPLHVPLYKKTGSLSGAPGFTAQRGLLGSGELFWSRPQTKDGAPFSGGFTAMMNISAPQYIAPQAGEPVLQLGNGWISLEAGGLIESLIKNASLGADNSFTFTPPGADAVTLSINPANGVVRGSFVHPNTQELMTLRGVVDQRYNTVNGFFLNGENAGTLLITPLRR